MLETLSLALLKALKALLNDSLFTNFSLPLYFQKKNTVAYLAQASVLKVK
jgi:hypothetical protein